VVLTPLVRHDVPMRRIGLALVFACLFVTIGPGPPVEAEGYRASVSKLPPGVRELMRGSSWRPGCPVGMDDLRLVRVTHVGFDGEAHPGKLVVHRWFADDMVSVFRKLFRADFPIRQMRLVDRYGADDMRSMAADNTSAFNCRYRGGVCCTWSMHAFGKAIDINPVENPYVGSWGVSPPNGAEFVDRSDRRPGMIYRNDRVWRAFRAIGWEWGGTWTTTKDYQHFSANGR
jgi:hypothetical protein